MALPSRRVEPCRVASCVQCSCTIPNIYLPEVFHAVDVVVQQVRLGDAALLHLGEVGHAGPLVVGHPTPLVREVEAVRVLALDQGESFVGAVENRTGGGAAASTHTRTHFINLMPASFSALFANTYVHTW